MKGIVRDVRAHARGFDDVNRMTQTGREYFGLPVILIVNLDDFLEQAQTIVANVVQPTQKGTDEGGAGFGRANCLRR